MATQKRIYGPLTKDANEIQTILDIRGALDAKHYEEMQAILRDDRRETQDWVLTQEMIQNCNRI